MDPRRYKAPPPYYCKVLNLESTAVAGVRVLSEYARKKENAVSCHVIGRLPVLAPRVAFGFVSVSIGSYQSTDVQLNGPRS